MAPLLLAGIYFYFHLYLQRLWEALSDLPAVFPDGVSVDRKVDPWLLTGLVRRHVRRLASESPAFGRLQALVVVLSTWWAVPVTLVVFWGRYLRRHEWWGTALHILLLAAVVAGAFLLHRVMRATLRRSGRSEAWRTPWRWGVAIALVAVPVGAISLSAIESIEWWGFGYSVFAELEDAEVSIKPPGWTDKKEQIEFVVGARLAGVDLRGARARGVFLIKADLTGAGLEGANLNGARLERANLIRARLERADLGGAQLERADLSGARLEGANLNGAQLERADLRGARLEGANLNGARLGGADLREARLEGAILSGADLRGAELERANLIRARLERADLREARLEGADLSGARLGGANLSSALCLTHGQLTYAQTDGTTNRPPSLPSTCPPTLPRNR